MRRLRRWRHIPLATQYAHGLIDHDIARTAIECAHLGTISAGDMAVRDASDVQSRGWLVVAEQHVKVLHQRSARTLQRMVYATELRYDWGIGQHGNHTRFTDLQTTGISVLGPHLVEWRGCIVLLHLIMFRRFLVNGLAVVPR